MVNTTPEQAINTPLDTIPVTGQMIEELSSHGLITADARHYALGLLYPPHNWGAWVSRMLLVWGVTLMVAGIAFFSVFNWAKITPAMRLFSIQAAMLGCLGTAYFYGLDRFFGKIMVLASSVLVGVFLSVFEQIYSTGAGTYQLFMMWSLLILPWVILSKFAVLWLVWLGITSVFMRLYWIQVMPPGYETALFYECLAFFYSVFLGLRELGARQGKKEVRHRWTRMVLVVAILVCALILILPLINKPSRATFGAALSILIHGVFYGVYRRKIPDIWALAATTLSLCIIVEYALFTRLKEAFPLYILAALMGMCTVCLFTVAIIKLRTMTKAMENHND